MLGAGLSGLALTLSLIELNGQVKIALIDSRTSYHRDHIWSFWNHVNANLQLPFDHQWNSWRVKFKSKMSLSETKAYPYTTIFADSYYRYALGKIEKASGVDLFLGENIVDLSFNKAQVSVQTKNRTVTARLLFDSRPPKIETNQLLQDFFGIVVCGVDGSFDPKCVTLMHFSEQKNSSPGFHFFYLLPFSDHEALVESVFVGFERMSVAEHRARIVDYLIREFGVRTFEEGHLENGHIPMHAIKQPETHFRHYHIGAKGGLVRASTGYGDRRQFECPLGDAR